MIVATSRGDVPLTGYILACTWLREHQINSCESYYLPGKTAVGLNIVKLQSYHIHISGQVFIHTQVGDQADTVGCECHLHIYGPDLSCHGSQCLTRMIHAAM